MVNKSQLAQRVLFGVARECDFAALGADEVRAIKSDTGAMHYRYIEREVKELGEREFEHFASTEHVDGMGDVIKVGGWDLLRLKTGRVPLFWGHDSSPVPMGLVNTARRGKAPDGKRALITRSSVYEPELYNDSEWGKHVASIVTLMQRGDMPGCSVGFIPKSIRWPEKEEREELGMGQWGVVYEEQELYELSVTPIPCNPYANEKKELDRVKAAITQMVGEKQISAEEGEWLQRSFARGEDEWLAARRQRTLVPITRELSWVKGAERTPNAPAAPDQQAVPTGEGFLRRVVAEEQARVIRAELAPIAARMVAIEEQLAAQRRAVSTPSETQLTRGETEGREEHCPPTERTTGPTREADPIGFQRALLAGALRDLKTSTQGPDHAARSGRASVAGSSQEGTRR